MTLIERICAAEAGSRVLFEDAALACGWAQDDPRWKRFDALVKLEAWEQAALMLLPEGWVIGSLDWWPYRKRSSITLLETGPVGEFYGYDAQLHKDSRAEASTPALAICAAAIQARSA